jgi:hypothetical protein
MKVKELIEELSKLDPNMEVLGKCTDPTDYTYKSPIKSIEIDTPFDDNGYSGVDDSEMEWDECYEEDEETGEEIYIGPKVVIIDLGDV